MQQLLRYASFVLYAMALSACASIGTSVGISLPVGKHGGVGVTLGSGGQVSGTVGVSVGGGSVNVGAAGQLPKNTEPRKEEKIQEGAR